MPRLGLAACAVLLGVSVAACAGQRGGAAELEVPPRPPPTPTPESVVAFEAALDTFAGHDRGQWTESACREVAGRFEQLAKQNVQQARASALYNSGLAYQRCEMHKQARTAFKRSGTHQARAQLVLYQLADDGNLDRAIADLESIIREAKFQNVDALVHLATLEMRRAAGSHPSGAAKDLNDARLNLQRALAIDDSYMPAQNQLAQYYLAAARRDAGGHAGASGLRLAGAKRTQANQQQLDLAALVASQALRKGDRYAPLHNTAGLIQVELANYNGAVRSFQRARELDPKLFEAHMNHAAVNMAFRGFAAAEAAYRAALELRPRDYDAHLGLALALRAQASLEKPAPLREAKAELERAKRLDPERPEAYYNEAILVEEFDAKRADGPEAVAALKRAQALYGDFKRRAARDTSLKDAVKRATERSEDIDVKIEIYQ